MTMTKSIRHPKQFSKPLYLKTENAEMEDFCRKSNLEVISEGEDFDEPSNSSQAGENNKTPKGELMNDKFILKSESKVDVEASKNEKAEVTDSSFADSLKQSNTSNAYCMPLESQGLFNLRMAQRRPSREVRIPPDLSSVSKEVRYMEYRGSQVHITPSTDTSEHRRVSDIVISWEKRLEEKEVSGDEELRVTTTQEHLGQKCVHGFDSNDQVKPINHRSKGCKGVQTTPIEERNKEGIVVKENTEEVNDGKSNEKSPLPLPCKGLEDNYGSLNKVSVVESFLYKNDGDSKESGIDSCSLLLLIIGFGFMTSGLFSVIYLYTHQIIN